MGPDGGAVIDPYVPDRGNPGYVARHYDLDLRCSVATNRLDGTARLRIEALEDLPRLALDLHHLRVVKVLAGGRPATWHQRGDKVVITPSAPLAAGEETELEVRYGGNPRPARSPWGPIGWEELRDGVLVAAQPSGACTWFPCNDVAAHKATFTVAVTVDAPYRAVSNGALRGARAHGSATTWSYEQAEPTSPYLLSLHLGRYDEWPLTYGPVAIRAVAPSALRPAIDVAFARLPAMMDAFVDRFGPYPFAAGYRVIVCPEPLDVPVEAQGQAAFGTNHLDGSDERLIAHELAHQWFGNSVTAASWRDVWLHEGFACYAEWLWSEAAGEASAGALAAEHHARLRTLPGDLVIGDPGAADMFDDRVYKRGALTLHAIRGVVGDDAFFTFVRRWADTHRHGVATTADLAAMVAEVSGRPVDDLLDAWLGGPELPALSAG